MASACRRSHHSRRGCQTAPHASHSALSTDAGGLSAPHAGHWIVTFVIPASLFKTDRETRETRARSAAVCRVVTFSGGDAIPSAAPPKG